MEWYILDRIEGQYAVMENEYGTLNNIPLKCLKGKIGEGNIYLKDERYFIFDEEATTKRRNQIDNIMENMWS